MRCPRLSFFLPKQNTGSLSDVTFGWDIHLRWAIYLLRKRDMRLVRTQNTLIRLEFALVKQKRAISRQNLRSITSHKCDHDEPILYGFIVSRRINSLIPKSQESKGWNPLVGWGLGKGEALHQKTVPLIPPILPHISTKIKFIIAYAGFWQGKIRI